MNIEPHVQRMIDEHRQLKHRTTKLSEFFGSKTFEMLEGNAQHMMRAQYGFMCDYLGVLSARLDLANPAIVAAISVPWEEQVVSTGYDRTANNTLRHNYRVLNDAEKAQMQAIKDKGAEFINLLHEVGGTNMLGQDPERFGSANLTLSFRHIEDAVMRAVKHITK